MRDVYSAMFEDGESDPTTGSSHDGCECLRETKRAILVRFQDGREKWIPRTQVLDSSEVLAPGDIGELLVTQWFSDKLEDDEDGGAPTSAGCVEVADCVAIRETEKAICVRLGQEGAREEWFPKGHIVDASDVRAEGDVGTLRVSTWIARQKNLGGAA